ncbi:MAG: hypothetical protein EPN91_05975 [Salinibacterium sp.]|nr:MAG: hypothetical protein EPN91_05975 [Salinibacterium sp.]
MNVGLARRSVNDEHRIPYEVSTMLGFYVYALRDPRSHEVFYIGKGIGERVFSHQKDADDSAATQSAKLSRISEIRLAGWRVEHLFLRVGIPDEATAFLVEQAVIDSYAATGLALTNLVKGHHAHELGLSTVEAAIAARLSEPMPAVDAPLVMFKINRAWRPDSSPSDIYEASRGHWKVGWDTRSRAKYALGVAFGIVRGAYEIESWFESTVPGDEGRWGFVGRPAPELERIVGTNIRAINIDGSQNPYRKFLTGFKGAATESVG